MSQKYGTSPAGGANLHSIIVAWQDVNCLVFRGTSLRLPNYWGVPGTVTVLILEAALPFLKTHLIDNRGQFVRSAKRQFSVDSKVSGTREIAAEQFSAEISSLVDECLNGVSEAPSLITVTGADDGLVLLDARDNLIRPVIAGGDFRATVLLDQWIDSGISAAGFRRSGSAPATGSSTTLLRYLLDTDPESLEMANLAGNPVVGIAAMIAPTIGHSAQTAPLQVVDPYRGTYDEELIDLYRLRTLRHVLPPLGTSVAPFEPGGLLNRLSVARPPEAMVHSGTITTSAVWQATRTAEPTNAVIHLGRSLDVVVPINRVDTGSQTGGTTVRTGHPQTWLRVLSSSAGLAALDWLLELIGANYQVLNTLVDESRPGAGGLIVIPVVAPNGERGVHTDRRMTGRITGLTEDTSPADLARAVCEGIAFTARNALSAAAYETGRPVHFCGGGVRAPAFRQLLADVLQRPIIVDPQPEPIARGAALAALQITGTAYDEREWRPPGEEVFPDTSHANLYEQGYRRFVEELGFARHGTN